MRRKKFWWWASVMIGPAIMLGLAILWASRGLWPEMVTSLVSAAIFGIYGWLSTMWYMRGYRRGMDDFAEAAIRSENQDEFLRLTLHTPIPKPWE